MVRRRGGGPLDSRRTPSSALVTRLLSDHYAAPEDQAYWDKLESRIMKNVAAEAAGRRDVGNWSTAFRLWFRAGVAAACLAASGAGVAAWSSRHTEARVAYTAILDSPAPTPVIATTYPSNVSEREAAVQYVLSH